MAKYAEGTTVSPEASQMEIKRVIQKYGATGFAYGETDRLAQVEFEMRGRRIRFRLAFPDPDDKEFTHISAWRERTPAQAKARHAAEVRRLWRVLLLTLKSKLEAVQSGTVNFEEEFLANIVLPNQRTVGEWLVPQIADSYATGRMPPLLPSGQ
jgi:hypothetical protein